MSNSRDIMVSLKIGATVFLVSIAVLALIAHSPAAPWHKMVRAVLAPGFFIANGLLSGSPSASQPEQNGAIIGAILILASAADITIYSVLVFLLRVVLRALRGDPVPLRGEQSSHSANGFAKTALRSIQIGFATAIVLVFATTLIKPGFLDWTLAAADRICKLLLGAPSHSAEAIYILSLTVVNGLLISALALVIQSCYIGVRHALRG
jgi:hypothetical protein